MALQGHKIKTQYTKDVEGSTQEQTEISTASLPDGLWAYFNSGECIETLSYFVVSYDASAKDKKGKPRSELRCVARKAEARANMKPVPIEVDVKTRLHGTAFFPDVIKIFYLEPDELEGVFKDVRERFRDLGQIRTRAKTLRLFSTPF